MLRTEDHGPIRMLRLGPRDGPPRLGPAACAAAVEALGIAEGDPAVRVLVLTGEGLRFCVGGPWALLHGGFRPPTADAELQALDTGHHLVETLHHLEIPTISAVEGEAAGLGCALALACDLRVASSHARFQPQPEALPAAEGASDRWLAEKLPRPLRVEMLGTGDPLEAQRLHALGQINRLSPPGGALREALSLAESLLRSRRPLQGLRSSRTDPGTTPLHRLLAAERQALVARLLGPV